jgi:hypothetical protein
VFDNKVEGRILRGSSCKRLLSVVIFMCLGFTMFSQNDLCSGAVALSTGVTTGATSNTFGNTVGDPATPSCSADSKCSFTGWYKYTTSTQGGDLTISMATGAGAIKYGSISIYSGTCGAFTQIACGDANSVTSTVAPPTITASCLAPNTTYYIMIWDDGGIGSTTYPGTFTLTTTFTANNDVCAGAFTLSNGVTTGTTTSCFTNTTGDPSPSCDADGNKESTAWYTYTTPAGSYGNLTVSLTAGTMEYAALTLYSGSCGSFTEVACSDPNTVSAAPSFIAGCLSPSTTYYVMVWSDGLSSAYNGTYSLTTTYTATSGNDCCGSATTVTLNPTATIGSYTGAVSGDNTTATNDGTTYCFLPHKNQWYSFTAPVAGSYYCGVTTGTMVQPELAIYSGNCNSLTLASCAGKQVIGGVTYTFDANNSQIYLDNYASPSTTYTLPYSPFSIFSDNYTYGGICNLTAGQTAYVMVGNYPNGTGNFGTYTLTVSNLKNDDINSALIIDNCGSAFQGTTIGGTNCSNNIGNGLMNNIDHNSATACTNAGVTSCGTNGAAGAACFGGATTQTDANANGGDIGYSIENDSWYELCVISASTVTITFSVNTASCLAPTSTVSPALQLSAFSSASNSTSTLAKIYGGYCKENISTSVTFTFAAIANSCYFFEVDGYSGANCDYTLRADMIPSCVLPVKLLYFTGTNEHGRIKLNWISLEERNAGKYVIERSGNGIDYTPIISQLAVGNTTKQTSYIAYDENPLVNKINYYRLSEYDKNGAGGLMALAFVNNVVGFPQFNVYPNPTTGKVNINIYDFGVPSVTVEILDMYGKTIWNNNVELTNGSNLQEVDLSSFEPGFYIVRTTDGNTFYKKTLVLTR